jgi:hypothetical protein
MGKNKWMDHVAKFRRGAGKGMSLSEALKAAAKTYTKKKKTKK